MNITVPRGFRKVEMRDFEQWLKTRAPDYVRDSFANGEYYNDRHTQEHLAVVMGDEVWANPKYL